MSLVTGELPLIFVMTPGRKDTSTPTDWFMTNRLFYDMMITVRLKEGVDIDMINVIKRGLIFDIDMINVINTHDTSLDRNIFMHVSNNRPVKALVAKVFTLDSSCPIKCEKTC